MSSIHLVGDNSEYTNQFNKPWRTGSTRVRNKRLQILVNEHANYGGGSGPLWATEGERASLTLKSGSPYIEGVCKKIHASSLIVEFAIHHSPYTWGVYLQGQVVAMSIFDIARYDSYSMGGYRARDLAAPKPISTTAIHKRLMSGLDEQLKRQFETEVGPSLAKSLIHSIKALTQYSERYVGSDEHSGHEHSSHAKRTFHKSMRQLIRVLEKDGLDKYQTPGCKK
jgi:hypothetical protein